MQFILTLIQNLIGKLKSSIEQKINLLINSNILTNGKGSSPFVWFHPCLFDLLQDAYGMEEGGPVTDVVHHHKPISPVYRFLGNTAAPCTLRNTTLSALYL